MFLAESFIDIQGQFLYSSHNIKKSYLQIILDWTGKTGTS